MSLFRLDVMLRISFTVMLFGATLFSAFAQKIELNALFSDGMVLQQNSQVPIFGFAEPNQQLKLTSDWLTDVFVVQSDENGKFIFEIPTPKAGGPYTLQINQLEINNVLIGEVWLGSGQSNMAMRLNETSELISDLKELSEIRLFTVPVRDSNLPLTQLDSGKWVSGFDLENIMKSSAVAYFFALTLHKNLNIPIGIILSSRGASEAEEWVSGEDFNTLIPEQVRATYTPNPPKYASGWYNGMIHPLLPYKIKGIIWYQGEGNAVRPETYPLLIETIVNRHRKDFRDSNIPFYMVQLASFGKRDNWPKFRLVQEEIADNIVNGGIVSTIDLGDKDDIHPKRKREVGERLAHLVLAKNYEMDFRFSSPRVDQVSFKRKKALLSFQYASEGLITNDKKSPRHFEVAGADGVFYSAEAKLKVNRIEVSTKEVSHPVSVRYFWVNYGEPNLFSKDGYPVSPFIYPVNY